MSYPFLLFCLLSLSANIGMGNIEAAEGRYTSDWESKCKDVKIYNSGGYSHYPNYINVYDWMRSESKLEDYVNGKISSTDYVLSFLWILVPLGALLFLTIFIGLLCGMYACCNKIFCWKFPQRLFTSGAKLCVLITYFVLSFLLLFVGSMGIYFLVIFYDGIYQTECMISKTAGVTLNGGVEDLSWKGIYYIYDKTENVSRALSNDKPEFESFVQNYNTKLLEVEEIPYTTLKKTYEDLKNLTVINPDPANVDNQPLINPEYIIHLGPPGSNGTNTNILKQDAEARMSLVLDSMNVIYHQANHVNDYNTDIIGELESDMEQLMNLQENLERTIERSSEYMLNDSQSWSTIIMIVLFIYMGSLLLCTLLVVLALIFTQINQSRIYRKFHQMTWICPCSIIAVGLIILIFMVPIGLTLIDSCDILDDYTTSQGLVTHPKVIDKASGKLLDVCLNGDGNLAKQIGMEYTTNFATLLEDAFATISENMDTITNPAFPQTDKQLALINQIATNPALAVASCPSVLIALNKWTNNNSHGKADELLSCDPKPQDFWAFVQESCLDGYKYEKTMEKDNYYDDFSMKRCLLVDNWAETNFWGEKYWKLRYNELSCSSTAEDIIQQQTNIYLDQLFNFGKEVKEKFLSNPGLIKYIQKFKDECLSNIDLMSQNINIVNGFQQNTKDCIDEITNATDGLLTDLNCTFLKEYYGTMHRGMCEYLGPGASMVVLCITLIVIFGTLAAFVGVLLVERYRILNLDEYEVLGTNATH